jgi:hypothetical protein
MVNMTEEEIQKILNPEDYQSEVVSFNILGLHEAALEIAERNVKACEDRSSLYEAVVAAISNKCYELAAQYADRLRLTQNLNKGDIHIISLAYNYAGRHPEAYIHCRQAVLRDETPDCTDFYSLACRGSKIHRLDEALVHILRAFSCIKPPHNYLFRKAFLDSELADVWKHSETSSPNLHRALVVHFQNWKSIVTINQFAEPERMVDHADLKQIPEEFHILLTSCSVSTFETPPLKSAQNPELHRRYLKWQDDQVQPRLLAFSNYMEKVTKLLEDCQGRFAAFQAHKGRFGAARVHLLEILRKSPDADPSKLPEIPLLAPLIAEFRNQFEESPEAFVRLVKSGRVGLSPEKVAELPLANRNSALAALRVARRHQLLRQHDQAIQALSTCAKIWPWDEVLLIDLARSLSEAGHAEKALVALDAIPPRALPDDVRKQLEQNINSKNWERISLSKPPEIPLPNFREFHPGANQEFLQWLEEAENSNRSFNP